jgi:hypothetical protein
MNYGSGEKDGLCRKDKAGRPLQEGGSRKIEVLRDSQEEIGGRFIFHHMTARRRHRRYAS